MAENTKHSTVTIEDKRVFYMGGVLDIRGFDEEGVVLETGEGRVHVEGNDLRIESLSREDGGVVIRGEIDGVYFTGVPERRRGIFGK